MERNYWNLYDVFYDIKDSKEIFPQLFRTCSLNINVVTAIVVLPQQHRTEGTVHLATDTANIVS